MSDTLSRLTYFQGGILKIKVDTNSFCERNVSLESQGCIDRCHMPLTIRPVILMFRGVDFANEREHLWGFGNFGSIFVSREFLWHVTLQTNLSGYSSNSGINKNHLFHDSTISYSMI